jgi:hypothetical protein
MAFAKYDCERVFIINFQQCRKLHPSASRTVGPSQHVITGTFTPYGAQVFDESFA